MADNDYPRPRDEALLRRLRLVIGPAASRILTRYLSPPRYPIEHELRDAIPIRCCSSVECSAMAIAVDQLSRQPIAEHMDGILASFTNYSNLFPHNLLSRSAYEQLMQLRPQIEATPRDVAHMKFIPVRKASVNTVLRCDCIVFIAGNGPLVVVSDYWWRLPADMVSLRGKRVWMADPDIRLRSRLTRLQRDDVVHASTQEALKLAVKQTRR